MRSRRAPRRSPRSKTIRPTTWAKRTRPHLVELAPKKRPPSRQHDDRVRSRTTTPTPKRSPKGRAQADSRRPQSSSRRPPRARWRRSRLTRPPIYAPAALARASSLPPSSRSVRWWSGSPFTRRMRQRCRPPLLRSHPCRSQLLLLRRLPLRPLFLTPRRSRNRLRRRHVPRLHRRRSGPSLRFDPAPVKKPTLNCDPPYFVDPQGIRHMRKECLK